MTISEMEPIVITGSGGGGGAVDALVVHLAGAETVTGAKRFDAPINLGADVQISRHAAGDLLYSNDAFWVGRGNAAAVNPAGPDLYVAGLGHQDQFSHGNVFIAATIAAGGTLGANQGGSLSLGGPYAANLNSPFARMVGAKENATAGEFGGYFGLFTRPNGGNMTERLRVGSLGEFTLWYTSTHTTPFSAAAMLSLRQVSNTAGNSADIGFYDSAGNAAAGIAVTYTDHAAHYGTMRLMTRGASGGFTTRLLIADTSLTLYDGMNINTGTVTGTTIGGNTSHKLGFFGKAPVVQPAATPAAAVDPATTMALVNDLRTKLISLGLIA